MTANIEATHAASHEPNAPKYRADIDGLRAVAILPVVAFHAFPYWVKGGFIGVDVFFVISGFLISSIILGGLENGTFSFIDFYSRRIRRIFPALLLVLVASYAFGWFALLADEYQQLGRHIAAGAGFVSNFLSWQEAGYFDKAAEVKPLLHLWSLGIEEQFYIVWPLIVYLCWKRRFNLLSLALLVVAVSFVANVTTVARSDLVQAFYSPVTRFWELMVGSALAYATQHQIRLPRRVRKGLNDGLARIIYQAPPVGEEAVLRDTQSLVGAILIGAGALLLSRATLFPGWWALLPTMGAFLIIAAGPNAWFNRAVLARRPLVWLGLISYPLYLWHWPVLSFVRIVNGVTPSPSTRVLAVLASVLLAWLTYRLVERPIRFGKPKRITVAILCVSMAAVGLIGYGTFRSGGFASRVAAAGLGDSFEFKYNDACDKFGWKGNVCRVVDGPAKADVALVGDSFANAYSTFLVKSQEHVSFKMTEAGMEVCPLLLGYGTPECESAAETAFNMVKQHANITHVFMAGNFVWYMMGSAIPYYEERASSPEARSAVAAVTSPQAFNAALVRTVSEYRKLGRTVVILLTPPYGKDPKECAPRFLKVTKCEMDRSMDGIKAIEESNRKLMALWPADKQPIFFDPFVYLCDGARCRVTNGGTEIFYVDSWHLSVTGDEFLAEAARSDFGRLLERSSIRD